MSLDWRLNLGQDDDDDDDEEGSATNKQSGKARRRSLKDERVEVIRDR